MSIISIISLVVSTVLIITLIADVHFTRVYTRLNDKLLNNIQDLYNEVDKLHARLEGRK